MTVVEASGLESSITTPAASRVCHERTFRTWEGMELFYRAWLPAGPARGALVLFHRGHEHSGRFEEMVQRLGLEDVAMFAYDARGHGRSPGERGYADCYADVIRDMDAFVRDVSREYQIPCDQMIVLGHSVAAVGVAAWVHDYAPPIRAMILATPALRVKLYVPFALPALRLLSRVRHTAFIKSYVKAKMLTHDPQQAELYAADPLISRQIAVNILLDLFDTSTRLMNDAGAIRVPTLLLAAGSDWVVKRRPQRKLFQRLGSGVKRMEVFDRFHHAIFHEKERERAFASARQFVREQLDRPAISEPSPLLRADREGYTRAEYDRLVKPLPWTSPRALSFAAQRLFLRTIGRLNDGVCLGWRTGFDSGQSLDYIYENQPRGITPLGRLIDRFYLNAIGWRGIRQRKVHLQQTLRSTIQTLRSEGRPVRIVDIASGPGRYLLEVLSESKSSDVSAILRDHNANALEQGRKLARQMKVANVRYETGDAFDPDSLAAIEPPPTVAIVSGLYELFPDNEKVLASLRGLAAALRDGGYLIYTNQPWHPQVEMIARVLRNRDGNPWIMRRRTQAEMDELVRSVWFHKIDMLVDRWGIFTVSLAHVGKR